jgi:hypothetical protein
MALIIPSRHRKESINHDPEGVKKAGESGRIATSAPMVTPDVGRTGLIYSASWKAKTDVCRVIPTRSPRGL